MKESFFIEENLRKRIAGFHLPRYEEIPDVGLFLDQTVRLVNQYLQPLGGLDLTSSMVSNYVKHRLIDAPVKKLYHREQIAYLTFLAAAKTVLILEDVRILFQMQQQSYSPEIAYNYFCEEFENAIQMTFGNQDTMIEIGTSHTELKMLLRAMIITVAHKIHLDKFLEEMKQALPLEDK